MKTKSQTFTKSRNFTINSYIKQLGVTFSCLLDKLTTRFTAVLTRAAKRAKAEEKLFSLMRCSITERRRR